MMNAARGSILLAVSCVLLLCAAPSRATAQAEGAEADPAEADDNDTDDNDTDGADPDGAGAHPAERDGAERDGAERDGAERDGAERDGAARDGAERDGAEADDDAQPIGDDRRPTDPGRGRTEGAASSAASGSVVVDARQSELQREQAAMEDEAANGEGGVPPEEDEEDDGESLDHEYQLGIRIGAGVPFQFALRYNDGPLCATPDDPSMDPDTFCVFVGSGIIDGELTFGVTPDLEIAAMARVGMVPVEPTDDRQILVGLGIRSYLSPESLFKFFLGVKAILDITQANGLEDWGPVDFGVRGEAGVQLDIVRYVGLYAQVAVNVTFLRAFAISPDVTGGVQIRFP